MALLSATADEEKADRKAMSCRCGRMPPSNLRELKAMIAKKQVVFPGERKRVMRAILDHPEIIAFGTATSIAAACGVSSATVVRLAGSPRIQEVPRFQESVSRSSERNARLTATDAPLASSITMTPAPCMLLAGGWHIHALTAILARA